MRKPRVNKKKDASWINKATVKVKELKTLSKALIAFGSLLVGSLGVFHRNIKDISGKRPTDSCVGYHPRFTFGTIHIDAKRDGIFAPCAEVSANEGAIKAGRDAINTVPPK